MKVWRVHFPDGEYVVRIAEDPQDAQRTVEAIYGEPTVAVDGGLEYVDLSEQEAQDALRRG